MVQGSSGEGTGRRQSRLGDAYRDGDLGLPREDDAAVSLYRDAAAQGHAGGQANLAFMLEHHRGVPRDEGEALVLYRRSAEQGFAFAQNRLGDAYRYGQLGLDRDDAEAVRWYRLSAAQDHGDGQESLAYMYAEGRGVERNDEEALAWHRFAASHGNVIAERTSAASIGRDVAGSRGITKWRLVAAQKKGRGRRAAATRS
jgi:TPR repeat protein